ncbi:MAG: restriction endonuclease subunit S [Oscillospiraceae bacterium]|nr:restriction endonuclease subunit S [Oscillospiraceae bacterium]
MKLLDACEFIIDCPHSTAKDEGFGYPLIRTPNIGKGRLILEGVHRVSENVYNQRNARGTPEENDLIFAREAPAGNVAIIKSGQKVCLGQRTVLIRPNTDIVDPDFLTYFLLAPQQQYGLLGTANGSTVAHVNLPTIRNLEISLPDLPIQKHIGAILSAYDDLIENNQKQIKLLEEAAQRLYKEWFVDLRFPGWETAEIVDGVPVGWRKEAIGNLLEKITRTKQVMTAEYMKKGIIPIIDQSKDFIAGYTNIIETIVDIGKPVIVFGDHTRILKFIQFPFAKGADGTQLIVSNDDCMPQSLFYCSLINVDLSNYHYARHFKYLKAEEILVPNKEIAESFDSFAAPIFNQMQKLRDKSVFCAEARDRLLPKLMSGELEV